MIPLEASRSSETPIFTETESMGYIRRRYASEEESEENHELEDSNARTMPPSFALPPQFCLRTYSLVPQPVVDSGSLTMNDKITFVNVSSTIKANSCRQSDYFALERAFKY
jgi:hypothetical protein